MQTRVYRRPVESAGASARYHTQDQDGRHPGEAIFCAPLSGVACVPRVSKDGVQDFEVQADSDV